MPVRGFLRRRLETMKEDRAVKKIEDERLRKITHVSRAEARETEAARFGAFQAKQEYRVKRSSTIAQKGARATSFLGEIGSNLSQMGFGVGTAKSPSAPSLKKKKKRGTRQRQNDFSLF